MMHRNTAFLLSYTCFCAILLECVGGSSPVMILSPDHHITVVEGHSLEVNCSVTDSAQAEKWQRPSWKAQGKVRGSLPQKMPSFNTVTLYFKRVNRSDAGFYKCSYNTTTSMLTKGLFIKVDSRLKNGAKCGSNQFICEASSNCIPLIYRCDNQPNCEDGSDEFNCKDKCVDKFKCRNGKCIDKDLVCDKHHEDNCGDMSDEYCVLLPPVLPSTAESKKDVNTTINATKVKDDHMTWLKTTLYVVIGCTVSVVFFISVIVVAVFRIRMKRNNVRRNYNYARARRRQPGADPVNYQAEDPFLNMAPSANYGNIIVNVNNGIQYVPGAEFSEFTAIMEAPPSYSDVEREIFDAQNIPPPDYSTIDRNPLRVNNINVTPSRRLNQASSGQSSSSSRRGSRDRSTAADSRPRTQNAAVQTLTHRSQGGQRPPRPTSGSESLSRQPTINVQGGQIVLSNSNVNPQSGNVSENETVPSQSSERPSSALIQVDHGQIMLSNPNLSTANTDASTISDTECNVAAVIDSSLEDNSRSNIQVCEGQIVLANESSPVIISTETDRAAANESNHEENPRSNIQVCEGQIVFTNESSPLISSAETDRIAVNDSSLEDNPSTNIQVCDGQIVFTNESSPLIISESSAETNRTTVNDSSSRRQLDVCEGQIVLK